MAVNRVTRPGRTTAQLLRYATEWGTVFPGSIMALTTLLSLYAGGLEYGFGPVHLLLLTGICGSAIFRVALPPTASSPWVARTAATDLVALPICAITVAASALGPDAGIMFPFTLMVLVWAAASLPRLSLFSAVGLALACELGRFLARGGWDPGELVMHALFVGAFAAGGTFLLRGLVAAARRRVREEASALVEATAEEARALGLDGDKTAEPPELTDRISAVGASIERVLALSKAAVQARSAVLMTRDGADHMRVRRANTSETELLHRDAVPVREGLLAVVARQGEDGGSPVVRISPLEGRTAALPYYTHTPARIRSTMAVPIRRSGSLLAVLWFDRAASGRPDGDGFTDEEARSAEECARLVADVLDTERSLLATETRSQVLDQLMEANRVMSEAFTPDDVYRAVLSAAARFAPVRFAALLTPTAAGDARIMHATGDGAKGCLGQTVPIGTSLATMVLKTPAAVPPSRTWNSAHGPLIAPDMGPDLRDGDPVVAIPLRVHGKPVGSLVVVGELPIDDEQADLLELLSCQAAVSVEHAQALDDLQSRATTDALTDLDNRATVLSKLEQSLARCQRLQQELAVMVLDIDHFKTVNDTHGHATGDSVLRQVAGALGKSKRLNDSVGRIGGEEFLLVLENTGEEGARLVAERIRQQVAKLAIPSANGTFGVTASIGFAIASRDGNRSGELVKRADSALYQAKNNGRDQVCGYRDRLRRRIPTECLAVPAQ